MKKRVLALLLVLVMVLGLAACGSGGSKDEEKTTTAAPAKESENETEGSDSSVASDGTVTIGVAIPLTGSLAENGAMLREGVMMAVEEINANGGINGMELVADIQDDQGDANQEASIANMFASNEEIMGVVGIFNSTCVLAAAPIYEEAGLPLISTDASSPAISEAGEYIFRVKNSDTLLATQAIEGAIKDGHTKFAIVYQNDDYGAGILNVATALIEKNDLEVVCTESVLAGEQTDFSTSIQNIIASDADAIMFALDYNEGGQFMKQMVDANLDIAKYGTDNLYTSAFIDLAGSAAEGTVCLSPFDASDTSEVVQTFVKNYQEFTGTDGYPSMFQAETYDAVHILAEAIENAGTDRAAIQKYMSTMAYQGVIGDCTFDENGDVNLSLLRCVVRDGKFAVLDE